MRALALIGALAVTAAACGDDAGSASGVTPAPYGEPWSTLSAWQLFEDAATQAPSERVVRYEVNAALFSDYTSKHRFIWLPEGEVIGYEAAGPWTLPVGAIVVKTFAMPVDLRDPDLGERLLETRLLVHEPTGWTPLTYVYDADAPDEAKLTRAGAVIPVEWTDAEGQLQQNQYVVPTASECLECHGQAPTRLLGVKTAQVDRVSDYGGVPVGQIEQLHTIIGFDEAPPAAATRAPMPDPFGDAPLYDRARAYLDANCAHCHSAGGTVSGQALHLDWESTDPGLGRLSEVGVCKVPTSAGGSTCGRTYDIVPGDPDASVMMCRVESTARQVQMPPLGRTLQHAEGAALIRAWIAAMPPDDCTP